MKTGDIITIFASPIKLEYPIDQARLIEKRRDLGQLEEWFVEYTNEPDHQYSVLIKKDNGTNKVS